MIPESPNTIWTLTNEFSGSQLDKTIHSYYSYPIIMFFIKEVYHSNYSPLCHLICLFIYLSFREQAKEHTRSGRGWAENLKQTPRGLSMEPNAGLDLLTLYLTCLLSASKNQVLPCCGVQILPSSSLKGFHNPQSSDQGVGILGHLKQTYQISMSC